MKQTIHFSLFFAILLSCVGCAKRPQAPFRSTAEEEPVVKVRVAATESTEREVVAARAVSRKPRKIDDRLTEPLVYDVAPQVRPQGTKISPTDLSPRSIAVRQEAGEVIVPQLPGPIEQHAVEIPTKPIRSKSIKKVKAEIKERVKEMLVLLKAGDAARCVKEIALPEEYKRHAAEPDFKKDLNRFQKERAPIIIKILENFDYSTAEITETRAVFKAKPGPITMIKVDGKWYIKN